MKRNAHIKTLFVDFDGVLHPVDANSDGYFTHAGRLADVLADTAGEVVISSSWRFHHELAAIKRRLPEALARRIVGTTGDAYVGAHARYQEIQEHLRHNACKDWRALDDSAFEFPRRLPQLILCNGAIGLDDTALQTLRLWLR